MRTLQSAILKGKRCGRCKSKLTHRYSGNLYHLDALLLFSSSSFPIFLFPHLASVLISSPVLIPQLTHLHLLCFSLFPYNGSISACSPFRLLGPSVKTLHKQTPAALQLTQPSETGFQSLEKHS